MKLNRPGIWLAAVSLAAFLFGMTRLFRDRLDAGDIYPAYSTLRSDPLGCRALFTALERYPELTVNRAYARSDFRGQRPGAAYFFLGLDAQTFAGQGETLKELDSLAREGHRVILAFAPLVMEKGGEYGMKRAGLMHRDSASLAADSLEADSGFASVLRKVFLDSAGAGKRDAKGGGKTGDRGGDSGRDSGSAKAKHPEGGPTAVAMDYLRKLGFRPMIDTAYHGEEPGLAAYQGNWKDTLTWLSGLYFDSLQGPWMVLYRRGGLPVAVERPVGSGSIALVSDSYFASNQAQFGSRPTLLIGLLAGGSQRIFFDERHFGVRQDDAIANLLRRYRLHWMLPSLLLLLGLYLWKGRNLLEPDTGGEAVRPEPPDSRTALAGLLRRNLTAGKALEACFSFWKEGAGRASESQSEIESVLARRKAAGNGSLADGYAEIQAILNRRKRP